MSVGVIRNLGSGASSTKILYEKGVSKLLWSKDTSGITENNSEVLSGVTYLTLKLVSPASSWHSAYSDGIDCNGFKKLIIKGFFGTYGYGGSAFRVGTTFGGNDLVSESLSISSGERNQMIDVTIDVSALDKVYISMSFYAGNSSSEYAYCRFSEVYLTK